LVERSIGSRHEEKGKASVDRFVVRHLDGGWMVTGIAVVAAGVSLWSVSTIASIMAAVSVAAVGVGLVVLVVSTVGTPRRALQLVALLTVATIVAIRIWSAVHADPTYGSDEAAFDQYAASLLLHGLNPYTRSLRAALTRFGVPDGARTYLLSGRPVTQLSYPSLSFLPLVALQAAGAHTQSAIVAVTIGWIATMAILWCALPGSVRWVAPTLALGSLAIGYISAGLTDPLALPLLVLALWHWDRAADPAATRWWRTCGPVALGLACAVKQTPWLVAPFLVVAVGCEARARHMPVLRTVVRYSAIAGAAFVLPNLAFIVWSPGAWWHAVWLPLESQIIPGGQGVVGILLSMTGGDASLLDFLGLAVLAACVLALVLRYPSTKRMLVPLAMVVLVFPARSFGSYLVFLAPLAVVGATTVEATAHAGLGLAPAVRRCLRGGVAVALSAAAVLVLLALRPGPVAGSVRGATTIGDLQVVDEVSLMVRNTGHHTVTPRYVVTGNGLLGHVWDQVSGPTHLPPGSAAAVTLAAPDVGTMPASDQPFTVDILTGDQVSVVHGSAPSAGLRVELSPQVVAAAIRPGQTVVFSAQVTSPLGAPVRRRGVAVALTQSSATAATAGPGVLSIDGAPEGASPVVGHTNSRGVVTFTLRVVQTIGTPILVEAWLMGPHGQVGSVSPPVSLRTVTGR
jgi:uncharacterized membrane protein